MLFVGITGGIGAGKSEILAYIKKHYKCEVYLADEAAHAVKEAGEPCYDQLVELMGRGILDEDGQIDRFAMASRIFVDNSLLKKVNAIIHPAVQKYVLDKVEQARNKPDIELLFVEAALLIEAGYKDIVDELWYIHADTDVRRERLMTGRGYTPEKIAQIMDSQMSEEIFRRECDFCIDNSGSLMESYKQIDRKLEAFTWQE